MEDGEEAFCVICEEVEIRKKERIDDEIEIEIASAKQRHFL